MAFDKIQLIDTKLVSYNLLHRHTKETREAIKNGVEEQSLGVIRYRQIHEALVIHYYKNIKLNYTSKANIKISNKKLSGAVMSLKPIREIILYGKTENNAFYSSLLYTPEPFIFIPQGELYEYKDEINGIYEGEVDGKLVLFMNHMKIMELDLEEMITDIILDSNIIHFFVGFAYQRK